MIHIEVLACEIDGTEAVLVPTVIVVALPAIEQRSIDVTSLSESICVDSGSIKKLVSACGSSARLRIVLGKNFWGSFTCMFPLGGLRPNLCLDGVFRSSFLS